MSKHAVLSENVRTAETEKHFVMVNLVHVKLNIAHTFLPTSLYRFIYASGKKLKNQLFLQNTFICSV